MAQRAPLTASAAHYPARPSSGAQWRGGEPPRQRFEIAYPLSPAKPSGVAQPATNGWVWQRHLKHQECTLQQLQSTVQFALLDVHFGCQTVCHCALHTILANCCLEHLACLCVSLQRLVQLALCFVAATDIPNSVGVPWVLPTACFLRTGSTRQDLGAVARHLEDGASLLQHRQRAAEVTLLHVHCGCVDELATVICALLALDFLHATAVVGCLQHTKSGAPLRYRPTAQAALLRARSRLFSGTGSPCC